MTALLTSAALLAQHQNHTPAGASPSIDGAVTPDLISDETAIRSFLLSITESRAADGAAQGRLRVKLARIRLTQEDTNILIAGIYDFHEALQVHLQTARGLAARLQTSPNDADMQAYVQTYQDLGNLSQSTFAGLLNRLSTRGAVQLLNHIAYVKTRIKVYQTPNMNK
jgi:hypothetical protein